MSEKHREPEVPEARVPVVECPDGLAGNTLNELAPIHSVKSGTLQNACSRRPRVVADLVKNCSFAHRQVDEQPSKRSKKNDDKSAVAMLKKYEQNYRTGRPVVHDNSSKTRQLGCVFQDMGPAAEVFIDFTEELGHAETNPTCKIHESYCTSHKNSRPKSFARISLPR